MAAMLRPVEWWAETFAAPMFRARARSDFISWMQGPDGAGAFAELRARLTPPRPDVRATTAAATALSKVDISVVEGASADDRSVEHNLMPVWPAAVPVEIARHWRNTARAMIVAIPADPLPDADPQLWTETRRSAVRDVQAATGWLARADVGAGDMRLAERLGQMGLAGRGGRSARLDGHGAVRPGHPQVPSAVAAGLSDAAGRPLASLHPSSPRASRQR